MVRHMRLADAGMAGERVGHVVTVSENAVQGDIVAEKNKEGEHQLFSHASNFYQINGLSARCSLKNMPIWELPTTCDLPSQGDDANQLEV